MTVTVPDCAVAAVTPHTTGRTVLRRVPPQPASAINSYCALSASNLTATVSAALSGMFLDVVRLMLALNSLRQDAFDAK